MEDNLDFEIVSRINCSKVDENTKDFMRQLLSWEKMYPNAVVAGPKLKEILNDYAEQKLNEKN